MSTSFSFTRRIQGKPEDIVRQLPEAFENRPYEVVGDSRIEIRESEDKQIVLRIKPRETRELGELELPMQDLEFDFEGYDEQEVERIMDHFDTCTMRVGGGL